MYAGTVADTPLQISPSASTFRLFPDVSVAHESDEHDFRPVPESCGRPPCSNAVRNVKMCLADAKVATAELIHGPRDIVERPELTVMRVTGKLEIHL